MGAVDPLGERVDCVDLAFKITEYSNHVASNFALSLNIPRWKLLGWFRRPELWATGDRQLHQENTPVHASYLLQRFFGKTSNHPGDSGPLQPRFGTLWLLVFPKIKITFEREWIAHHQWDLRKYNRTADGDWETCVRSQGAYIEGDWGVIVLCTIFLVSSSTNVSIFHITWLDTFWTDLVYILLQFKN